MKFILDTARLKDISWAARSEEHTSELQSQSNLVCRLLLEKKKKTQIHDNLPHALHERMTSLLPYLLHRSVISQSQRSHKPLLHNAYDLHSNSRVLVQTRHV